MKKSHKSKSLSAAAPKQAADCPLTSPSVNPTLAKLIEAFAAGLSLAVAECMLQALQRRLAAEPPGDARTGEAVP